MKLNELINELLKFQANGHGEKEVMYYNTFKHSHFVIETVEEDLYCDDSSGNNVFTGIVSITYEDCYAKNNQE